MKRIRIVPDYDLENPNEFDGAWKLYSFGTRHSNYAHPETVGFEWGSDGLQPNIGLRRKLAVGTAFMLSYYEHGQCQWMVKDGHIPAGVEFQWDGTRNAGILICEDPSNLGAKTYTDRLKDAESFCEIYTSWANGDGYGYIIEDVTIDEAGDTEVTDTDDSCFGFYGNDAEGMAWYIAESVAGYEWEIDDSEAGSPWDLEREIVKAEAAVQAHAASETVFA